MTAQQPTEAALEAALIEVFRDRGAYTIHGVPDIPPRRPGFWRRYGRNTERRVNHALASIGLPPIDGGMRRVYWQEVRKGQDVMEDVGGFFMRCWCAAVRLPYREATFTYSGFRA